MPTTADVCIIYAVWSGYGAQLEPRLSSRKSVKDWLKVIWIRRVGHVSNAIVFSQFITLTQSWTFLEA